MKGKQKEMKLIMWEDNSRAIDSWNVEAAVNNKLIYYFHDDLKAKSKDHAEKQWDKSKPKIRQANGPRRVRVSWARQ